MERRDNGQWHHREIWCLEVEWEAFIRSTCSAKTYRLHTGYVYDFLKAFPKKHHPKDFLVSDICDYAARLEKQWSPFTVERAYHSIRAFFQWMRDVKGLEVTNPASQRVLRRTPVPPGYIELPQLGQLLNAAHSQIDRRIIAEALRGKPRREIARIVGLSPGRVQYRFAKMRKVAGFPILLKHLPIALERLYMRLGELSALNYLHAQQLDCSFTLNPVSTSPDECPQPLPFQSQAPPEPRTQTLAQAQASFPALFPA